MGEHRNAEFVRQAYEAMTTGNIPWILENSAPDVVFHQTGNNPLAGTFKGQEAMLGHFGEFMQAVGGDFSFDIHDVLATDDHAVVLRTVSMSRDGIRGDFDEVDVWHIRDGKAVEFWAIPRDPYALDAFLS